MVCSSMESRLTHLREWQLPQWCLVAHSSVVEPHLRRPTTRASPGQVYGKSAGLGAVLGFCLSCLVPWQSPGLEWSRGVVSFLTRSNFCHFGRTETYMKTLLCENRRKFLAVCLYLLIHQGFFSCHFLFLLNNAYRWFPSCQPCELTLCYCH